ncbi:MAG: RnfH family protein, partial [Pseudohongiellaceae bacterium]
MTEPNRKMQVEVAYARPDVQVIIPLEVAPGTTVQQAIELSGILEQFPEIDLDKNKQGV